MIAFTHSVVDLATRGDEPVGGLVPRGSQEVWYVPYGGIHMDRPIEWRVHQRGSSFYIPLVPYLVQSDPALAMAFMLQLGLRAGSDLPKPVRRIHVAVGSPVNNIEDDNGTYLQCFAGFGLLLT